MKRINTFFNLYYGKYSLIFIYLISFKLSAQNLSMNDLQVICSRTNWEYANQFLMSKGWEYYESEKGSSTEYNSITWSLNKSFGDEAEAWFYLYTYQGLPNKVIYSVFNKPAFSKIKKAIKNYGYKLNDTKIEDNALISNYSNKKFILRIITSTKKPDNEYSYMDESITTYRFILIKKSGIYDPDNGKKIFYYQSGEKKVEYSIRNGKLNGLLISYYKNGNIKKKGNFSYGKESGIFTEYDEDGNMTVKYSMKNGKLNGKFTYFENGKISYSNIFVNDKKNGEHIKYVYDKSGELFVESIGQYLDDKKNGTWKLYYIDNNKKYNLTYTNYISDLKNGKFQDVKGDSLIIGNYQNNILNGEYYLYVDLSRMISGGIIKTDTTKLYLLSKGRYSNGLKNGEWIERSIIGYKSQGKYSSGKKTGKWNYYYGNIYADIKTNTKSKYANKLYLTETFNNDKKNGISERFSKFICISRKKDTCTEYKLIKLYEKINYKNDKKNGFYILKDSLNNTLLKGKYIDDKKNDEWIESYLNKENKTLIFNKGKYINNKKNGKWIEFADKNIILKQANYNKGKLDGESLVFFKNGKIKEKKIFENDYLKEWFVYDPDRNLISIKHTIIEETFYYLQVKKEIYKNGRLKNSTIYRVEKDNLNKNYHDIYLKKDKYNKKVFTNGEFIKYNNDELPVIKGKLKKDNKQGVWKYYFYDQKVRIEIEYQNNKPLIEKYYQINSKVPFNGVFYFKNNKGKEKRKIKNGFRNGSTIYYDLYDNKIKKVKYKNGIKK